MSEMDDRILSAPPDDYDRMTRYLLGELSPEEAEAVEAEYFTKEEFFESLQAVEDALIDDYAAHRLPEGRRHLFERRFLRTADGRERVRFAREMLERASRPSAAGPSPKRGRAAVAVLMAAGLVLAVLGGAWSYVRIRDLGRELGDTRASRDDLERSQRELRQQLDAERRRADRRTQEPEPPRSSGPARHVETWTVKPGLTRDRAAPVSRAMPPPGQVHLRLVLEGDGYRSYAAALMDAEGRYLWREDALRSSGPAGARVVDIILPSELFAPGTYVVMLRGSDGSAAPEPVDAYHLRVAARRDAR
jgi:hypothetical protein